MNTFHIHRVGCERRALDAARLNDYLLADNLKKAATPGEADAVFLFTCGLPGIEADSWAAIAKFARWL